MWREFQVDVDDGVAEGVAEVMNPVDEAYHGLGVEWLRTMVWKEHGRIWLYEDERMKVAVLFTFNPKLGLWRVYTAGFKGDVAPEEACQVGMLKVKEFMEELGVVEAYAIRRFGLDHPLANKFLDWVPKDPNFEVTVEHEMMDRVAWRMRLKSSVTNDSSTTLPALASD